MLVLLCCACVKSKDDPKKLIGALVLGYLASFLGTFIHSMIYARAVLDYFFSPFATAVSSWEGFVSVLVGILSHGYYADSTW
jgi:hypothetical protein